MIGYPTTDVRITRAGVAIALTPFASTPATSERPICGRRSALKFRARHVPHTLSVGDI
jgi:hypothetical protein